MSKIHKPCYIKRHNPPKSGATIDRIKLSTLPLGTRVYIKDLDCSENSGWHTIKEDSITPTLKLIDLRGCYFYYSDLLKPTCHFEIYLEP